MVFEDFGSPKQHTIEKIVTLTYGKAKLEILPVQRGPAARMAGPLL